MSRTLWRAAALVLATTLVVGCIPESDDSSPEPPLKTEAAAPTDPPKTDPVVQPKNQVPAKKGIPATPIRPAPGGAVRPPAGPGPESLLNKPVPDFTMNGIDGKVYTPDSLKGKVVLVDFWATWCGPCIKASPVMQTLHEKYGDRGLVVIGANTSERDKDRKPLKTPEKATEYSKKHNYTYVFTYGTDDFKNACKVRGIPTMLVIDREGVVRKVQVGFSPALQAQLEKAIESLLEKKL